MWLGAPPGNDGTHPWRLLMRNSGTIKNALSAEEAATKRNSQRPLKSLCAGWVVGSLLFGAATLVVAGASNFAAPKVQVFADPDGALMTLNLGEPTDTSS